MSVETIAASPLETIVGEVVKMKAQGQRLLTMSAVSLDENTVELLYHFDQDLTMTHYRLTVDKNKPVPSISPVYFAAFLVGKRDSRPVRRGLRRAGAGLWR